MKHLILANILLLILCLVRPAWADFLPDTNQEECYNSVQSMSCPEAGANFYGQDAQTVSWPMYYYTHDDGTVTAGVTGLVWQQSADTTGDRSINSLDKMTVSAARNYCEDLSLGSRTDWRLPAITELYSLFDARGTDPNPQATSSYGHVPFLDTTVFSFAYGDLEAGERLIDAQYVSDTSYGTGELQFGVNFADGRIKGYGVNGTEGEQTFYVKCVSGDGYGDSQYVDNNDGTISDTTLGIMWAQDDSGTGMDWQTALAWVQQKNEASYLGYSDWRLPNIKELQSLVDYTRSPDITGSAAINGMFNISSIVNEAEQADYPYFWSSTTHVRSGADAPNAMYVCFGRGLGYMNEQWQDVHGAGCQRSDPKTGDPADYPQGLGPQGDAVRIDNYVRLVRGKSPAIVPALEGVGLWVLFAALGLAGYGAVTRRKYRLQP